MERVQVPNLLVVGAEVWPGFFVFIGIEEKIDYLYCSVSQCDIPGLITHIQNYSNVLENKKYKSKNIQHTEFVIQLIVISEVKTITCLQAHISLPSIKISTNHYPSLQVQWDIMDGRKDY